MLAWLELTTGLLVRRSSSATASSERQAFFGVVVVDPLVAGCGGVGLAFDVEDLEAERFQVGPELFVVPVWVGRGHRDLARAEEAQRLDHRRAGGHRGYAGRVANEVEHLPIPARAAVEAARRAAVGDDVHAGGGEIARAGFDLGVHAVHPRRALR